MSPSSAYMHPSPTSSGGHFRYNTLLSTLSQRSNSLASTASLSSISEEESEDDEYETKNDFYYSDADDSSSPRLLDFCRTSSPSPPPSSDFLTATNGGTRSSSDSSGSSTEPRSIPCTPLCAQKLGDRLSRIMAATKFQPPSTPRNLKRALPMPNNPHPKKRKFQGQTSLPICSNPLGRKQDTSDKRRSFLDPASQRRASSLRAGADNSNRKHTLDRSKENIPIARKVAPSANERPPPDKSSPAPSRGRLRPRVINHSVRGAPVPIIAPPADYMPTLSLSADAQAKVRLQRYLERENAIRAREGLTTFTHLSKSRWEERIGLESELRTEVVEWILKLDEPAVPNTSPEVEDSDLYSRVNLMDQLRTSPETKFHAVWMFLRYYYLLNDPSITDNTKEEDPEIVSVVTYDTALASLALSVKFHRDVLEPLVPIYSTELETIGGHSMDYSRLEKAQQDLLYSFSYSLGDTPDGILNEIWIAVPSLQELIGSVEWWNIVLKATWSQLLKALLEPDVLRYPISLLTTAALVQAIRTTLVVKYDFEEPWNISVLRQRNDKSKEKRRQRAEDEAEGVFLDIQEALKISDKKLQDCLYWFFEAQL